MVYRIPCLPFIFIFISLSLSPSVSPSVFKHCLLLQRIISLIAKLNTLKKPRKETQMLTEDAILPSSVQDVIASSSRPATPSQCYSPPIRSTQTRHYRSLTYHRPPTLLHSILSPTAPPQNDDLPCTSREEFNHSRRSSLSMAESIRDPPRWMLMSIHDRLKDWLPSDPIPAPSSLPHAFVLQNAK